MSVKFHILKLIMTKMSHIIPYYDCKGVLSLGRRLSAHILRWDLAHTVLLHQNTHIPVVKMIRGRLHWWYIIEVYYVAIISS